MGHRKALLTPAQEYENTIRAYFTDINEEQFSAAQLELAVLENILYSSNADINYQHPLTIAFYYEQPDILNPENKKDVLESSTLYLKFHRLQRFNWKLKDLLHNIENYLSVLNYNENESKEKTSDVKTAPVNAKSIKQQKEDIDNEIKNLLANPSRSPTEDKHLQELFDQSALLTLRMMKESEIKNLLDRGKMTELTFTEKTRLGEKLIALSDQHTQQIRSAEQKLSTLPTIPTENKLTEDQIKKMAREQKEEVYNKLKMFILFLKNSKFLFKEKEPIIGKIEKSLRQYEEEKKKKSTNFLQLHEDITQYKLADIKNGLLAEVDQKLEDCKQAFSNAYGQCKIIDNTLATLKENKDPSNLDTLAHVTRLNEMLRNTKSLFSELVNLRKQLFTQLQKEHDEEVTSYLKAELARIDSGIRSLHKKRLKLKKANNYLQEKLSKIKEERIDVLLKNIFNEELHPNKGKSAFFQLNALVILMRKVNLPSVEEEYINQLQKKLEEYNEHDLVAKRTKTITSQLENARHSMEQMLSIAYLTRNCINDHEFHFDEKAIERHKENKYTDIAACLTFIKKAAEFIAIEGEAILQLTRKFVQPPESSTKLEEEIFNRTENIDQIKNLHRQATNAYDNFSEILNKLFRKDGTIDRFLNNVPENLTFDEINKRIDRLDYLKKLIDFYSLESAKKNELCLKIEDFKEKMKELLVKNIEFKVQHALSSVKDKKLDEEKQVAESQAELEGLLQIDVPDSLSEDQTAKLRGLRDHTKKYLEQIQNRSSLKKEVDDVVSADKVSGSSKISGEATVNIDSDFQAGSYHLVFNNGKWSLFYINEKKEMVEVKETNSLLQSSTKKILNPRPTLFKKISTLVNNLPKKQYKDFSEEEKKQVEEIKKYVDILHKKEKAAVQKPPTIGEIKIQKLQEMKKILEGENINLEEKEHKEWLKALKIDYIDKAIARVKSQPVEAEKPIPKISRFSFAFWATAARNAFSKPFENKNARNTLVV